VRRDPARTAQRPASTYIIDARGGSPGPGSARPATASSISRWRLPPVR